MKYSSNTLQSCSPSSQQENSKFKTLVTCGPYFSFQIHREQWHNGAVYWLLGVFHEGVKNLWVWQSDVWYIKVLYLLLKFGSPKWHCEIVREHLAVTFCMVTICKHNFEHNFGWGSYLRILFVLSVSWTESMRWDPCLDVCPCLWEQDWRVKASSLPSSGLHGIKSRNASWKNALVSSGQVSSLENLGGLGLQLW